MSWIQNNFQPVGTGPLNASTTPAPKAAAKPVEEVKPLTELSPQDHVQAQHLKQAKYPGSVK